MDRSQLDPQSTPRPHLVLFVEAFILITWLACCAGALLAILALFLPSSNPGSHTSISYWAAGHQLLHHANPYDGPAILALEQRFGYPADAPLYMRNLPPAAVMGISTAFFSPRTASLLWTTGLISALLVSIAILCRMYPLQRKWILPVSLAFAPCAICLISGQSSLFLLLGVMLYLRFHQTSAPLAGAGLWLVAAKPHLFLPFLAAVLLIACFRREFRPLFWCAGLLALSTSVALALDPHIFQHYSAMAASSGIRQEFVPSLGTALRFSINPEDMRLQFLPALAGTAWALVLVLRNRRSWDWHQQAPFLLAVSCLVAPYSWASDQVIVLPAIFLLLRKAPRSAVFSLLALSTFALVTILYHGSHTLYSVASSVAWFAWIGIVAQETTTAEAAIPRLANPPVPNLCKPL